MHRQSHAKSFRSLASQDAISCLDEPINIIGHSLLDTTFVYRNNLKETNANFEEPDYCVEQLGMVH